jgi:uncharacterized protein
VEPGIRFLHQLMHISTEAAVYLLFGFAMAALLHRYVSGELLIRLLGKGRFRPAVTAAVVGIPLPLCSCSVVPTALAIQKKGASRGATLAFFISTPETGVDSILLTYGLMGPVMAIARPLAAGISAVSAGWLLECLPDDRVSEEVRADEEARPCCGTEENRIPRDIEEGSGPTGSGCRGPETNFEDPGNSPDASCCGTKTSSPVVASWSEIRGFGNSFFTLFDEIAIWVLVGLVLSALVAAFLPDELFVSSFGHGVTGMAMAVVIGLPLYVCATASAPFAAVMVAKGFSLGAALVFLLVGPATNLGTMAVVWRVLGRWALLSYLSTIVFVAVLFGWGIDFFYPGLGSEWVQGIRLHESGASFWPVLSVVLLWCALVWRIGKKGLRFSQTKS